MSNIVETVKKGTELLKLSGVENAEYDSFALLAHITEITKTDYLVRGEKELSQEHFDLFMKYIERRCKREPLQHILGSAWFFGREFVINRNVLIPRADTEVLVEKALGVIKDNDVVLDMCTGSGCIITTLSLERKLKKAVGVDLSEKALEVAVQNAKRLNADVTYIHSDLFENVDSVFSEGEIDVLVSNPPYIESAVIETLSDEVRLYDPLIALDGMEDGLHFYRRITASCKRYLKQGGWLIYEIGYNQGSQVKDILLQEGFDQIEVLKDYAGLNRVVMGKLTNS